MNNLQSFRETVLAWLDSVEQDVELSQARVVDGSVEQTKNLVTGETYLNVRVAIRPASVSKKAAS